MFCRSGWWYSALGSPNPWTTRTARGRVLLNAITAAKLAVSIIAGSMVAMPQKTRENPAYLGRWVVVSVAEQRLFLHYRDSVLDSWPVSTARAGVGCVDGSFCTPSGWHQVAEKIGCGAAVGTVFRARVPTGDVYSGGSSSGADSDSDDDLILTRILWLRGLEPGVNQGEGVDSYARYIYIHGTHEEHLLGSPASHGCVRMGGEAVVALFDMVEVGTPVLIRE